MPLEIRTVEVERQIPIQNRPRPVALHDLHWYVVTEDTFDAFRQRFTKENGDFLFFAISTRHYEILALNMAELIRFIRQQKSLLVFYEEAIIGPAVKKKEKEK